MSVLWFAQLFILRVLWFALSLFPSAGKPTVPDYMVTLPSFHLLLSYLSPSLLDRVSVQQYCRSLLELSPGESRARVLPVGTACEQECKHEAPPPRVKAYNLGGKRGARAHSNLLATSYVGSFRGRMLYPLNLPASDTTRTT